MTLRLRLVVALVALVACGLAVFGLATYALYSGSEYQRLDAELRASATLLTRQLDEQAGIGAGAGGGGPFQGSGPPPEEGGGGGPGGGVPPVYIPPSDWAELRTRAGSVLSYFEPPTDAAQPRIPSVLPSPTPGGRVVTVGSSTGDGSFRLLIENTGNGDVALIAVPASEVTNALHRFVLIEAGGAIALLLVLSAGALLILRSGLRPLERMAGKARSISAGDLSQRVSPAGGPSEIGQLGLALNTMLGNIEAAFAEREATEQRLRQFLADASHELRTPLTSIQGFAELFRVSGDDARVDLPTILRRIEQESARMKELVEDLLLLARLDQTRPAERAPVDLAVLAADACSDGVAAAPDRAVTLDAPEPVVVEGDEAHLRQAITNLVANARTHTPDGTPIAVSARLVDGWAEVSVRDHGPGLDDAALGHAFDRFWRADAARVGAGAGLGLSIVAAIAAEHGGTAVAANDPGGGARFTLRLPLTLDRALRPTAPAAT
jgi:two-component system OmpR family sensor kinase